MGYQSLDQVTLYGKGNGTLTYMITLYYEDSEITGSGEGASGSFEEVAVM